jgi:hypothetical protein
VGHALPPADERSVAASIELFELPPGQHVALVHLLAGKSVPDAAAAAGVSGAMVLRWMRCDEGFRQALRQSRQEQTERLRIKLLNLGASAIDVLRFAVKQQRNLRVSLAILRAMGLLK